MTRNRDTHDTPVEINTLAAEHATAADEPVDITDFAEAEELAFSGPLDGERELTPTILDPCSECGAALVRVADWIHQPETAQDAWHHWGKHCVASQSNAWSWCPKSGWFTGHFEGRMRVYWERRRTKRPE